MIIPFQFDDRGFFPLDPFYEICLIRDAVSPVVVTGDIIYPLSQFGGAGFEYLDHHSAGIEFDKTTDRGDGKDNADGPLFQDTLLGFFEPHYPCVESDQAIRIIGEYADMVAVMDVSFFHSSSPMDRAFSYASSLTNNHHPTDTGGADRWG
jgi:hypothetical protein